MIVWREPTRALPLRWGRYEDRLAGGLILLISGGVAMAGSTITTIGLLFFGAAAHVAGWILLPATGGRRAAGAALGLAACICLLMGPQLLAMLALGLTGWLVVRQRPARSWPVVLLPVASGILLALVAHRFSAMLWALSVQLLVLVVSAWAARMLALSAQRGQRISS